MSAGQPLNSSPLSPPELRYSGSTSDTRVEQATPTRASTLRKTTSLRKRTSLRRTRSGRSLRADDLRNDDFDSVFHTPIPTTGTPTDILAERFQAWRKLLKDLITYFREIQSSYETRSKALIKISNVINNTNAPSIFLSEGGIDEATKVFRSYHKLAVNEANKARDIEDDVITQLNGLRGDLNQKIKEIKSLAGDFKNSVEKEKDSTRKAVNNLQDALSLADSDPSAASGKADPFIVRLTVEKQVEKQIEEENYLHRAYLNLEGSGRELESIIVGEIQKAYNAYAGILRREADSAQTTIEELRAGPLAMPKDHEWDAFVRHEPHFIDPSIPMRKMSQIRYPGQLNPAASEIKAGPLERKSKYLKSYTPGWYVLSATHLHEFKSPDHIHLQQPVMSLFLLDQKLGSHSQRGGTSHKFSLKGKQTGGMHRGHSWVFRAESYDTMMAWYEDIRNLTEKTAAERNAFVRRHVRSISGGSQGAPSVSSDGLEEDEADEVPYSGEPARSITPAIETTPKRPEPGRFPSDLRLDNNRLQDSISPSRSSVDGAEPGSATSEIPASPSIVAVTGAHEEDADSDDIAKDSKTPEVAASSYTQEPITAAAAAAVADGAAVGQGSEIADHDAQHITAVTSTRDFGTNDASLAIKSSADAQHDTANDSSIDHQSTNGCFRPTGHLMPSVLRHDTDMSVSDLHMPGDFPKSSRPSA